MSATVSRWPVEWSSWLPARQVPRTPPGPFQRRRVHTALGTDMPGCNFTPQWPWDHFRSLSHFGGNSVQSKESPAPGLEAKHGSWNRHVCVPNSLHLDPICLLPLISLQMSKMQAWQGVPRVPQSSEMLLWGPKPNSLPPPSLRP